MHKHKGDKKKWTCLVNIQPPHHHEIADQLMDWIETNACTKDEVKEYKIELAAAHEEQDEYEEDMADEAALEEGCESEEAEEENVGRRGWDSDDSSDTQSATE